MISWQMCRMLTSRGFWTHIHWKLEEFVKYHMAELLNGPIQWFFVVLSPVKGVHWHTLLRVDLHHYVLKNENISSFRLWTVGYFQISTFKLIQRLSSYQTVFCLQFSTNWQFSSQSVSTISFLNKCMCISLSINFKIKFLNKTIAFRVFFLVFDIKNELNILK